MFFFLCPNQKQTQRTRLHSFDVSVRWEITVPFTAHTRAQINRTRNFVISLWTDALGGGAISRGAARLGVGLRASKLPLRAGSSVYFAVIGLT